MARSYRFVFSLGMALVVAFSGLFFALVDTALAQVEMPDIPQINTIAHPGTHCLEIPQSSWSK